MLIVGLGNPGTQYAGHRHNIGFMAIEAMARDFIMKGKWQKKFDGLCQDFIANGEKHYFLMPMTFMNLSGKSVQKAVSHYKFRHDQILVIHDDLDVPFGRLRVKKGGGAGGHNGLKSIDGLIGKDYWRLRIGIDHPGTKELVNGHVLSNFTSQEQQSLPNIMAHIIKETAHFLNQDYNQFQANISAFRL